MVWGGGAGGEGVMTTGGKGGNSSCTCKALDKVRVCYTHGGRRKAGGKGKGKRTGGRGG